MLLLKCCKGTLCSMKVQLEELNDLTSSQRKTASAATEMVLLYHFLIIYLCYNSL